MTVHKAQAVFQQTLGAQLAAKDWTSFQMRRPSAALLTQLLRMLSCSPLAKPGWALLGDIKASSFSPQGQWQCEGSVPVPAWSGRWAALCSA